MEPEANFYEEFKKLHTRLYFSFPDTIEYKGYSFEKLNVENFEQLYLLFEDDHSVIVDERFKDYKEAKDYATYITVAELSHQNMVFRTGYSNCLAENMRASFIYMI